MKQAIKHKQVKSILSVLLLLVIVFATLLISGARTKQVTVVIQPGHSIGYDPGTTASSLITEAELNEKVAISLMEELDKRGYQVYLTHCSNPDYMYQMLSIENMLSYLV